MTNMSGTMVSALQASYLILESLVKRKVYFYLKYQLILRLIRNLQKIMQLLALDLAEQGFLALRMVF